MKVVEMTSLFAREQEWVTNKWCDGYADWKFGLTLNSWILWE